MVDLISFILMVSSLIILFCPVDKTCFCSAFWFYSLMKFYRKNFDISGLRFIRITGVIRMDDDSTGTLITFIFTVLFLIGAFCPVPRWFTGMFTVCAPLTFIVFLDIIDFFR